MVHFDAKGRSSERLARNTNGPTAPIQGFSHLMFEVKDLDRSEAFYRDVIGCDVIGRDLVNEVGPNLLMALNTIHRILLVQVEHEVVPFRPKSSSIHHALYLTPDQFKAAQERFKAHGYDIDDNRAQFRPRGEYSMDIFDPDGHRYQVQVRTPEANEVIIENVGPQTAGNVRDYAIGEVKSFVKGKFIVVRLEDGFIAYSRWCTHMNGLLKWEPEHWRFYCPMHGVTYNRRGENIDFCREVPPLRAHPLTISEDGTITVDPDQVIHRKAFDPSQLIPAGKDLAETGGTS
jgi:catechol 2,3-dioxygenase-like lactoylglutathione lyase family enzyme